jgi:hypothetical protein
MALASTILMIRPAAFGVNEETAKSNFFQIHLHSDSFRDNGEQTIRKSALEEFDNMVKLLRQQDIDVLVIEDTTEPVKPSAVFPNNWLSTSPDGTVSVFPMMAQNRRPEKREDILSLLSKKFLVKNLQDWSEYEVEGKFLEGTGSMVIDHDNKVVYACYSPRTDISVLEKYVDANGYQAIVFFATDKNGHLVYHTNVVMTLCDDFAVLCEEAIDEEWELIAVRQLLESTGHEVISISRDQMHAFAGNMLHVKNKYGNRYLVMSQTAYESLTTTQKEKLSRKSILLPIPVPVIENTEGGSVRCMMAEIFLEKK